MPDVAYDSVETWRLYSAEQSIPLGRQLTGVDDARAMVRRIRRSAWWRDNVGSLPPIRVEVVGAGDGTSVWSFTQPRGRSLLPSWFQVSIHRQMLNEMVLLHELAHCLTPVWGFAGPTRRGYSPQHPRVPPHGAVFAGWMTALTARFATSPKRAELADAYTHFGVQVATVEQCRQARTDQDRAIAEFDAAAAEVEYAGQPAAVSAPRVPAASLAWVWGDLLEVARRRVRPNGRMASRTWVAGAVSPFEPCTARDIAALERAHNPPTDPRRYRIALAAAAVLGVDPIYMRHQLGLVRWNVDPPVSLDELALVAPEWVALVQHLNDLAEARPARWEVPGHRG